MPRQKKNPDAEEIEGFELPENLESDELFSALQELDQEDNKLVLFRLRAQGGPLYLDDLTPQTFTLQNVKANFGGGKFRVKVMAGKERLAQRDFEIEGEPFNLSFTEQNARVHNPDGTWRKKEDVAKEIDRDAPIADRLSKLEDLIIRSMEPKNSGIDTTAILLKLLEQQKRPESDTEMLLKLKAMKDVFGPSESKLNMDSMVNFATKMLEMNAGGGEDGGAGMWLALANKVLPTLQELLSAVVQKRLDGQVVPQPLPQVTPLPVPAIDPSDSFSLIRESLKPYIPVMMQSAANSADPEAWAHILHANLPPSGSAAAVDWLSGDKWWADLMKIAPALQLQAAWWSELKNHLLAKLKGEEYTPENVGE